jgi:putative hydrolase of HD superfamily
MKQPPPSKPDIHRLIELQQLLLQFHTLERNVRHPADFNRHETDTEHSYTLAMAGWFLAQFFPELDQQKVIQLALVHDLLEIHSGDTWAYAEATVQQGKAGREHIAINKLADEWPDFPEMHSAIEEYEARQSNEAKFTYALDKLMPIVLNYLNQGRAWQHEGITFERLLPLHIACGHP